jgi:methyltransferase-like protein
MNNSIKGGRGKKAPYETAMCRIPQPVKAIADELTATYRDLLENYNNPEDPELINAVRRSIAKIDSKDIIAEAITDYIKTQIDSYGSNGSQKGKDFNMNTRKWDAFKDFMRKFI